LVALLLLKGFGILKAVLNTDPEGVTITIDLGFTTSAGLFVFLWHRLNQLNDTLMSSNRYTRILPFIDDKLIDSKIKEDTATI